MWTGKKIGSLLGVSMLMAASVGCQSKGAEPSKALPDNAQTRPAPRPAQVNLDAKPEKVVDGCQFCEGPAFGPDGWLYFVNLHGGFISKVSMSGELKRVADSPGPNGGHFDAKGNYIVCECKRKAVVSVAPDGKISTLVDKYQGRPFNGPNDIAIDADGGFYFTDPDGSDLNRRIGAVYYVRPDRTVVQVAKEMAYPNGINITADRSAVVVAETCTHRVHKYERKADGTFGKHEVLCQIDDGNGPDGMCFDVQGNLYAAWYGAAGVYVISPAGKVLGKISVPGDNPTNCCFGPPGTKWATWLFVTETAKNTIWRVDVGVQGMKLLNQL